MWFTHDAVHSMNKIQNSLFKYWLCQTEQNPTIPKQEMVTE